MYFSGSFSTNQKHAYMKTTFLTFCLLYQVAYCQTYTQQTPIKSALSEVFTENKGQVMDQYKNPNRSVLYLYSSRLFNLQLKQDGFSYELFEPVENQSAVASVQEG